MTMSNVVSAVAKTAARTKDYLKGLMTAIPLS